MMSQVSLPQAHFTADSTWYAPEPVDCTALWNKYAMPKHIRAHSRHVASIAHALALRGVECGLSVRPDWTLSCGLLHDIAKAYTIEHGGSHAQLGAAWIMAETGNPALAQGIIHHVHWPWAIDITQFFLPLAIIYADKRVKHDVIVPLAERFDDLLVRYGRTEEICVHIRASYAQAQAIEKAFETQLGVELHACSFDSGRLV